MDNLGCREGREEGESAGGETLKGPREDMDRHKYGMAFLQRSWDFTRKERYPQRDLRDIYRVESR